MCRLYSFISGMVAVTLVLSGVPVYTQKMTSSTNQPDKLVIYSWGDYIDPDLITKFTDEIGIKVWYETFDFNESMYTRIKQGGTTHGTAMPSDYMTDEMRRENLFIKLDKSKITGLENVGDELLGLSFDENNDYSISYFWGTLGIVYNGAMVENAPKYQSGLWNLEYANDIMLVDGAREVTGIGLGTLGYSFNTKSLSELNAASQKLDDLTPNIKAIIGDEMKGYMINGDVATGMAFSDEASGMFDSSERLHYVVPSEGSNFWLDNLAIPKTVKHIGEVYAFINLMLKPENAAQNAEYISYSTSNGAAKESLPGDIKNDQAFYPSEETIENLEIYDNLGQRRLGIYNDLYLQFEMYRK